ncbi:TIGR02206 family membrane protein [Brachybacterium kimchii]|uniref:TIGR02206 family membrane protein n=1 Tax=Brachybacterium kimchii TaxID=2942909 RepID=A0ABY4N5W5_9MICO|nr:TIGR02206 family membrane protein [Brachybacterium kimchii]UQN29940.1 TIGR02206 family membrane protein [Brachybacterium kimchii]
MDSADAPLLGHMAPYGAQHLTMLAVIAVLCVVAAVVVRRRADGERSGVRGPDRTADGGSDLVGAPVLERRLRILGWVLLANSLLWTLWGFMPWAWDIDESLPLHLSDVLRFIGPLALITRARRLVVITYYWGLTLNMQSVLTPDVNYFVWPPLEFAEYWIAHGTGVLIPVILVWGLRKRPTWRGFGFAYAATALWALIAMIGNALTGANYGYLSHAPAGPSLLDVMGPWPRYLLVEALAVAVVWALLTLPWVLLDRRTGRSAEIRAGEIRADGSRSDDARADDPSAGPGDPPRIDTVPG